jgi:long-chain acyl-CoA synthetase
LHAGERFLSYLPLAHILERAGLEQPALHLGVQVFFTERLETFTQDLQRAQPTVFITVPRLLFKVQEGVFEKIEKRRLDRLLNIPLIGRLVGRRILDRIGLRSARLAACGGAALPPEMLSWYRGLGLNLSEGYGTTETMITHVPVPGTVVSGYVGQAVRGAETRIGTGGEVLIKGPMNMRGYYNDPAATREALTDDGFYRTGDIGEIAADGQLRIVGRIKEQFKTSKGKYVAPAPIESKLAAHPAIESCCLMGAGSPSPYAVVVLSAVVRARCTQTDARKALETSLQELVNNVNAGLDPHERIAFLVIADGPWSIGNELLTPTMKLKRTALEALYRNAADAWTHQGQTIVWESSPNAATSTAA